MCLRRVTDSLELIVEEDKSYTANSTDIKQDLLKIQKSLKDMYDRIEKTV